VKLGIVTMHARRFRKKLPLVLTIALLWSVVPLLSTGSASAQVVITVPGDRPTIQSAIDAAAAGDTVLVAAGTYFENINFHGKAITVDSDQGPEVTIIDGNLAGPVVTFWSGEGRASMLRGFTLQRGDGSIGYGGGGVRIQSSSPTIQGNIITNNRACGGGGGVSAAFSSALIEDNLITNNTQFQGCSGGSGGGGVDVVGEGQTQLIDNMIVGNSWPSAHGGGIALNGAGTPIIKGNVIRANSANHGGGGIDIANYSDALIVQNTIVGNRADKGGGIYWGVPNGHRGPLLVNNTIADNQGQGSGIFATGFDAQAQLLNNIVVGAPGQSAIHCDQLYDPSPPVLGFNNVFSPGAAAYGGTCGDPTGTNGNISSDPLFVDPTSNDYHLGASSPSIDAGDNSAPDLPATDIDGDQRVINGQVDQGVDEYGVSAHRPGPPTNLTATRNHKRATVSWAPPADDGGSRVLSYTVSVSDGRTATVDASVTFVTFDRIRKQETYRFSVVATNAIGSSDTASVTLPAS
jgi:Right handed beta helix region/Fibronectin type III domain